MTQTHERRLQLFVSNVQEIKGEFIWQSSTMKHMAALLYTFKDKPIDNEAIRRCLDLIKENTGLLSTFRGNSALNIAAMLSLTDNSEEVFAEALKAYDLLKTAGFWPSDYLVVAAYQLATNASPDRYQAVADRARAFYDIMKSQHPFITSSDDYIYAVMLGLSDIDTVKGTLRMEKHFRALKSAFFSGNGVQGLAEVLVFSEQSDAVLKRILELRQSFRYSGLRMENQYTLPSLGVLALLPGSADSIVKAVAETFEYLREQKGFSAFTFSKQELELYASALTALENVEAIKNGLLTTTLSTSIANIIIAQQAAIAATAASSAAAAGAAGS
jgi:hypothetical protein